MRMDFKKTLPFDCEVRSIIKFLIAENKSGTKIHWRLCAVYGEEHKMNVQNVQWWQKMFKDGRTSTYDKEQEGRPWLEIDEMRPCMRILLDDNCSLTLIHLHQEMLVNITHEVDHGTVKCALKELEMHKVCAHWVSH